jgi:hypothetical protein
MQSRNGCGGSKRSRPSRPSKSSEGRRWVGQSDWATSGVAWVARLAFVLVRMHAEGRDCTGSEWVWRGRGREYCSEHGDCRWSSGCSSRTCATALLACSLSLLKEVPFPEVRHGAGPSSLLGTHVTEPGSRSTLGRPHARLCGGHWGGSYAYLHLDNAVPSPTSCGQAPRYPWKAVTASQVRLPMHPFDSPFAALPLCGRAWSACRA